MDTAWLAVRKTGEREWYDLGTASGCQETSRSKAKLADLAVPHYATANPVVRFAQVELHEPKQA